MKKKAYTALTLQIIIILMFRIKFNDIYIGMSSLQI